jgi:hypothetical protein
VVAVSACVAAGATAAVPQVRQTWAEDVTTVSASLAAQIDAGGLATSYHFDYLPEASYQANLQAGREGFSGAAQAPAPPKEGTVGKGSDEHVSQQISGLQREAAYRYRIVVNNKDGTVVGPERILRTKELGGPLVLLDGRGWELVSPVDKNGGEIEGPGTDPSGGVFQAASQGGAVTFSSVASFGSDAAGAPATSQYVSRRGAGGWATQNVTAPLAAGGYGDEPEAAPYQLFSSELSSGLLAAPEQPPLPGTGAPPGYRNYYLRDAGGSYTALLTYADVAGLTVPPQSFELDFAGASPDLSHVVLSTCAALTGDATEVAGTGAGCDPAVPNLYERSSAGWRLLNVLPGDSVGTPPARLAAPSGAISSDGSRVYWTDGTDLYLSQAGAATAVRVDAGAGGGGIFQLASADGSVALFTKAGNLYRYDVNGGATTNLTPGGGVVGVLGASVDVSSVYLLTAAGVVLNRGGIDTPVAAAADATNLPPSTGTARVSADGNRLAFVSASRALAEDTAHFDNETATGEPATEIYLYDAQDARLSCVSCSPTGERPKGPSTIPGAIANGAGASATRAYKPRVLSADGNRLFFDSRDSLVPADTNKEGQDVYEWEVAGSGSCTRAAGCLQLISAGSSFDSSFVDASAMGEDVFFLTVNSLVKPDPGSVDLYDAREGGGFAEPPAPFSCEEDACQPLPPPPDDPGPGTLVPGTANPPVHFPKPKKTNKSKKRKAHHRKHHRAHGGAHR